MMIAAAARAFDLPVSDLRQAPSHENGQAAPPRFHPLEFEIIEIMLDQRASLIKRQQQGLPRSAPHLVHRGRQRACRGPELRSSRYTGTSIPYEIGTIAHLFETKTQMEGSRGCPFQIQGESYERSTTVFSECVRDFWQCLASRRMAAKQTRRAASNAPRSCTSAASS